MIIVYFGCWRQAGHFLWLPGWDRTSTRDFEIERLKIPKETQLDASILFLPRPEQKGMGMATYLPAPDRTVFAWWGSPFDNRGQVNSALIVEGKKGFDETWELFRAKFPDPENRISKPMISLTFNM
jgi:hypothetical protein